MASIVLAATGASIGAGFGGTILGLSGAALGQAAGSILGTIIDAKIVASFAPNQVSEGARLESLRVTSSTEGGVIPSVFGRMKVGGNIFWATDFLEKATTTTQGGSGKGGGGGKVQTTSYAYSCSFAVGMCEGPISGIGRIWADGKPFDVPGAVWRVYTGSETQLPDPFIEAKMGSGNAPAYRGTAYVVFEELPLEKFGNRIPQLSFEVIKPVLTEGSMESIVRAVNLIPGAGEFVYATETITRSSGGASTPENQNSTAGTADLPASLDTLEQVAPNLESVSLVVSWFGTDLRAGSCLIQPGVETTTKSTTPKLWSVNGVARAAAHQVSLSGGNPAFGGTPADFAVVQAIQELKARGKRVTFYPFVMMDIPAGNTLPNPYSANAATLGQAVYPWRGRITVSPAAGQVGTVDKTSAAASQVAAFFGAATAANFTVSGTTVSWTGPVEWSYRRMVLHYAKLCAAAGGVDAFLIGSELRGLTTARSDARTYPAVASLRALAADCRSILGASTKIGYAADWSEYFGHQPGDGTGDVLFHLDPLWADTNIDFIGVDNYLPLSDWRDGTAHLDAAASWSGIHDLAYLKANVAGGEGFDWFYASDADRTAQARTPITDGAYGKPWVYRPKDFLNWWSRFHGNRPGGVEELVTWTGTTAAPIGNYEDVCWSDARGIFVAVGSSAGGARVMTSADGATWTGASIPTGDYGFCGICWSPQLARFLAVGGISSANDMMISADGVNWTMVASGASALWNKVCWSPALGKFCAVGDSGQYGSSADGITWTVGSNTLSAWRSVCWAAGLGKFVAVAETSGTGQCLSSADGTTWSLTTMPSGKNFKSVTWSPELGVVCAVGSSGSGRSAVSADLVNWTTGNFPAAQAWRGICWAAELGVFVAVADSGTTSRSVVSYDGVNWQSYASAIATFRAVCWSRPLSRFAAVAVSSTNKAMYSETSSPWRPGLKPIRFTEIGCPAVEKGTNQPNVFFDPKSSESELPWFSNGARDDAIQRRYLEALIGYWSTPANNPVSAVYGGPMIDMGEAAVWCWDARPYPTWPARADVWGDTANWTVGHWLNGRLGASGLGDLVLAICARSGIDPAALDVYRIADAVPGYVIGSLESPRGSIEPLARYFGFDVVESQGALRFVARGAGPVASITADGLVAGEKAEGEDIEFVRGQETELPRVLKWRLLSADEDYEAVTVEARRVTVDSVRVAAEQFAVAHPPEQADRNARRSLFEAWIGRETATFGLPPSRLALDPTDVVTIENDGRTLQFALTQIADTDARRIEAVRRDNLANNLGPGPSRGVSTTVPVVFGPPDAEILDLPQLSEEVAAHRPLAAVVASPWYGTAAIWRSATLDGFGLFATAGISAQFGVLAAPLASGPIWRFDQANTITVDVTSGSLASVSDAQLFAGENLLALQTAPGIWELIQFGTATIVSPGRWTLSRLLRGQAGTEDAMAPLAPIGSRIVFLGAALVPMPITESEIGMPWNWRIGPGDRGAGDALNLPLTFTPQGRGLRPWSPVRIKGVWLGSGDIAVTWLRRTRSLAGDSWTAPEVPLGETSESWDLLILNGAGATIRTVAGLSSAAWTYTAAMQSADFGGPVASLRLRIFQNGQLGRGAPADATLTP